MSAPLSVPAVSLSAADERIAPPTPLESLQRADWALDFDITYLNHGCFGARLREVLDRQTAMRQRIEARPVEQLDRTRGELIGSARNVAGRFVNMSPDDFGFVTNTTNGVNAILRSLAFKPGEELLTTNHVYNAVRLTMKHLAERAGAAHVMVDVPFPIQDSQQVIDAIEAGLTERTRLLVLDHVTSPTAVVYPVQDIIELCRDLGVDVLVDGAHVPGMLDLDIAALNPAYYVANLHKWVCAPLGAAFLWARPDRQKGLHPTTISHFLDEGIVNEFNWQATRDITPWLCAADSIEAMEQRYGWNAVRRHNHELATWAQQMLVDRWSVVGSRTGTPLDGSMIGSMFTLPVPDAARQKFEEAEDLRAHLYEMHRIEVPVFDWNGQWLIRSSCQVYNTIDDYEYLADAMIESVS